MSRLELIEAPVCRGRPMASTGGMCSHDRATPENTPGVLCPVLILQIGSILTSTYSSTPKWKNGEGLPKWEMCRPTW